MGIYLQLIRIKYCYTISLSLLSKIQNYFLDYIVFTYTLVLNVTESPLERLMVVLITALPRLRAVTLPVLLTYATFDFVERNSTLSTLRS